MSWCCALWFLWRNLKSIATPLCYFSQLRNQDMSEQVQSWYNTGGNHWHVFWESWDPKSNISPWSDQTKSTDKSVQVFLRHLKKQMGKYFCPICMCTTSYLYYHNFFPRNSYFTLQWLRRKDTAWLLSAQWTIVSVLCTLPFSKHGSGTCCLSPEKWSSQPLAGFALYGCILYHNNVLMHHFRWEWMLTIYPFKGHLFSDWGALGKQGLVFPHLHCRWACTKCRLTPHRQVPHSRMQTSFWKAVSVGYPHRCSNDCSSNIILHCAKAFFNLCFQMVLSCCHMSGT